MKKFATKAAATKGGVLEKAVGGMGSVRIRKRDGKIQEERTYPRSTDPRGLRLSRAPSFAHSAWRKQPVRWSLTMPTPCMKACIVVGPQKRKPWLFRALASALLSGVSAGMSAIFL